MMLTYLGNLLTSLYSVASQRISIESSHYMTTDFIAPERSTDLCSTGSYIHLRIEIVSIGRLQ
jgi:hypothetical protein